MLGISSNSFFPLSYSVVFEEEDESSDVDDLDFPVDSISRGFSISHSHDLRPTLGFEIISTRVCEEGSKKYVVSVYQLYVLNLQ